MFPKKIKACILFLLLTVPAALGAVWCAKHAYRYHLAVHPLPYSPNRAPCWKNTGRTNATPG